MTQTVQLADWKNLPRIAGIYRIRCVANGQDYVGLTQNLYSRIGNHAVSLAGEYHVCEDMQVCYGVHGSDTFMVDVLETGESREELKQREAFWVKFFRPAFNYQLGGARKKRSSGKGPITMSVPVETHEFLRREADRRGMKLRDVPSFLAELVEVTTPEQQGAAYSRFLERHRRGRQPA